MADRTIYEEHRLRLARTGMADIDETFAWVIQQLDARPGGTPSIDIKQVHVIPVEGDEYDEWHAVLNITTFEAQEADRG